MRILGVDPGLATTGYAILENKNAAFKSIDAGVVSTSKDVPNIERLKTIYEDCMELIKTYKPDCCAIEELLFGKNARTAFLVGQARGVILLACAQNKLTVFEYTPLQVKLSVTGYGNATKKQVQYMVRTLLKLQSAPKPDDVADAIAIAVCHAHRQNQVREAGSDPDYRMTQAGV